MSEPGAASAERVVKALVAAKVEVAASLPDSWLAPVLARIDAEPKIRHIRVGREDDAVGIAAGCALGGKRAAVVCQNAGVLLSANALAGYAHNHQLGFLVLAVYRGLEDDRFHYQKYKGLVTEGVLAGLRIPYRVLTRADELDTIASAVDEAREKPMVLLLRHSALFPAAG
ncbi:MAG TPA: thiamine pyrophosphate-binding protein [Candidatus Acidoferrales bacterium]|nr:thiamine pyrophosphate-binding protein [Candidatus Acidoferrales bacterium]